MLDEANNVKRLLSHRREIDGRVFFVVDTLIEKDSLVRLMKDVFENNYHVYERRIRIAPTAA